MQNQNESDILLEAQSETWYGSYQQLLSSLGFLFLFVSYFTPWNQSDVWQTFRLDMAYMADQRLVSQARDASYIQLHVMWIWLPQHGPWHTDSMRLMAFVRLLGLRGAGRALEWEGRSALCRRACPFNSAWFGKSVGTLVEFRFFVWFAFIFCALQLRFKV